MSGGGKDAAAKAAKANALFKGFDFQVRVLRLWNGFWNGWSDCMWICGVAPSAPLFPCFVLAPPLPHSLVFCCVLTPLS